MDWKPEKFELSTPEFGARLKALNTAMRKEIQAQKIMINDDGDSEQTSDRRQDTGFAQNQPS
jgi:hypothetical protein